MRIELRVDDIPLDGELFHTAEYVDVEITESSRYEVAEFITWRSGDLVKRVAKFARDADLLEARASLSHRMTNGG